MAGILRAAFCIQHNFSEVHPSCRVCQLTPLHLLYERGRAALRTPSPRRGIWGPFSSEGHLGPFSLEGHLALAFGAVATKRPSALGTALPRGSVFRLGTDSPELPSPLLTDVELEPGLRCCCGRRGDPPALSRPEPRVDTGSAPGARGQRGSMRASDARCSWRWVSASRLALF